MTAMACAALGVSRATVQRRRAVLAAPAAVRHPRARPARALTIPQQQAVLDLLHAPGFVDQAPAEVYATLLDQGIYHCSIRTMYRILEQHAEVRERRAQLRHPVYQKPELLAEGPNQVWSWDITKLMELLLSLRHPRHLQPTRGRLVRGRCGKCGPVQAIAR